MFVSPSVSQSVHPKQLANGKRSTGYSFVCIPFTFGYVVVYVLKYIDFGVSDFCTVSGQWSRVVNSLYTVNNAQARVLLAALCILGMLYVTMSQTRVCNGFAATVMFRLRQVFFLYKSLSYNCARRNLMSQPKP